MATALPLPEVLENGEFLEMGLKGLAHEGNDGIYQGLIPSLSPTFH